MLPQSINTQHIHNIHFSPKLRRSKFENHFYPLFKKKKAQKQNQKHTTIDIRWSSPTQLLLLDRYVTNLYTDANPFLTNSISPTSSENPNPTGQYPIDPTVFDVKSLKLF